MAKEAHDSRGESHGVAGAGGERPHEFLERRTGVAVVLNTSFNLRGEPIVHRPEEAIADFSHTGMDALFLGNYLVEKVSGGSQTRGA